MDLTNLTPTKEAIRTVQNQILKRRKTISSLDLNKVNPKLVTILISISITQEAANKNPLEWKSKNKSKSQYKEEIYLIF